jgi:cytochrome c-type biogenesis protein CcmF
VLLAIAAFSLSLLGAFIVRSGLITSVHAFAVDPERGIVLLTLLLVIIGSSLFLYALRAPVVSGTSTYGSYSREVFLLLNNIILVVATATILLGTLSPLVSEALYGEANKISVGPPYFNILFLPLMALLAMCLGIGTFTRWKKTSPEFLWQKVAKLILASVALGIVIPLVITAEINLGAMFALMLAVWIVLCIGKDILDKTANKADRISGLRSLGLSYYGMQLAHLGFAVVICGICLTSNYSIEEDVRMANGESFTIGKYEFLFEGVVERQGPNYTANSATLQVLKNGEQYMTMHPEKRFYHARGDVQTEADIDVGFFRDLFTALGDPRGDNEWVVRIHVKPFVFWIWFGALLMASGGVTAILDRRYRSKKPVRAGIPAADANDPLRPALES